MERSGRRSMIQDKYITELQPGDKIMINKGKTNACWKTVSAVTLPGYDPGESRLYHIMFSTHPDKIGEGYTAVENELFPTESPYRPTDLTTPVVAEPGFQVKDSGAREEYASGMRRDTQDGKPDYTLLDLDIIERWADHMTKGAVKYGRDNWRLADSTEELERFKSSAFRHFVQWIRGDRDEDHGVAVFFNISAAEYVQKRLDEATDDGVGSNYTENEE
jgi:hypothetical protein